MRKSKRSRILSVLMIVIMVIAASFTLVSAASLKTPVPGLSSTARGKLTVTAAAVDGATGFEVKRATNSKFKSAKTYKVKVSEASGQLSKSFTGLTAGKKYYVKVRAYDNSTGKYIYSAWSKVKSITVRSYNNAYVNMWKIDLEKSKKSTSSNVKANYMTPIKVYGSIGTYSKNMWVKVSYGGKIKYVWVHKGWKPFASTKTIDFDSYAEQCSNKYQQAVIEKTGYIYKNWKVSYPASGQSKNTGVPVSGNHYRFDCSGLVSYIINSEISKYDKAYNVTAGITGMYELCKYGKTIYNYGLATEFKASWISSKSALQPGDIVFFKEKGKTKVNHAGMYLGNGEFIHSTGVLGGMAISPLSGHYGDYFVGGGRVIPSDVEGDAVNAPLTDYCTCIYDDMKCTTPTSNQVDDWSTVTKKYSYKLPASSYPDAIRYYVVYESEGVLKDGFVRIY